MFNFIRYCSSSSSHHESSSFFCFAKVQTATTKRSVLTSTSNLFLLEGFVGLLLQRFADFTGLGLDHFSELWQFSEKALQILVKKCYSLMELELCSVNILRQRSPWWKCPRFPSWWCRRCHPARRGGHGQRGSAGRWISFISKHIINISKNKWSWRR